MPLWKSTGVWSLTIVLSSSLLLLDTSLAFAPASIPLFLRTMATPMDTSSGTSTATEPTASRKSPSVVSMSVDDSSTSGAEEEEAAESSTLATPSTTPAVTATATATANTGVRAEPGTHDELMYTLGVNLARQLGDIRPLVESGEELAQVAKGLLDTVVGRLSEEDQRSLLGTRGKELDQLIVQRANSLREKLEKNGRDMLKNMAETEGVKVLDSGVVVHVLEHGPEGPGEGIRASKTSVVSISYHGTLADGTVFDSTLGGDPINFPLAKVIPGWREGVMAMHEGETAMIGIPPEQGYGAEGTPDGRIPGGSTLFFKVQLVKVLTGEMGGSGLVGPDGKALKKNNGGESGLIL